MKRKLQSYVNQLILGKYGNIITKKTGNLLVLIRPKKASQLSEDGMTIVLNNTMSISERLMRNAILNKLEKNKNYIDLVKLHQNYWVNKGSELFIKTKDAFEDVFLSSWTFIFDELQIKLLNSPVQFYTIVEIGTGNGKVLKYLSKKFPKVKKYVGLDLSPIQTEINKEIYKSYSKLEFVAEDAVDWVKKHGRSQTIFVTSGGVLEYFTEEQLLAFLREVNNLGKTIFIAIEPNDADHDFVLNPNFQVYGYERSFSHNYPRIFKLAGFKLWHVSKKPSPENWYNLSFIGAEN